MSDKSKVIEETKKNLKEQGSEKTGKEIVPVADVSKNADLMDSGRFAQLQRVAQLFAASKLIPDSFRGDMASTFVACQLALRLDVDPFMMLQNMYVVHGKPGLQAQMVIALTNSRGPFTGPIQWEMSGEGMKRKCVAYATHRITGEVCRAEVSMEMAQREGWLDKPGSKWKTMPDLMLRYRSAAYLQRLYCPEVTMGMSTTEELQDIDPRPVNIKVFDPKPEPQPEPAPDPQPQPEPIKEEESQKPEPATEPQPQPETAPEPKDNRRRDQALGVLRAAAAMNGYAMDDTSLLLAVRDMLAGEQIESIGALTEEQIMRCIQIVDQCKDKPKRRWK